MYQFVSCHSERSEESLPYACFVMTVGIPRRKMRGFGMTS